MAFNSFPAKGGIPSGTTAQRPTSPVTGDTYYDGTLGFLLIWDGTAFIPCSAPAAQPTIAVTDVGTAVAYGTVQGSVAFTEGISGGKAAGFTGVQGSFSTTGASSPLVVTITGNPGSYSFNGTAYNGFGTSPTSLSVSQTLTSVPQAPTIGTATASTSSNAITVTWTNGATGGKNLSAITITPYLNGTTAQTSRTAATTSSTSYTFTDGQITGGSAYTFKVTATNANGISADSTATNSATMPNNAVIDFLVIAGGGGGGTGNAGGGGAGGYRTSAGTSGRGAVAEAALFLAKSTNHTVTVGAGGAGGGSGTNGSNSVFSTITSTGGGASINDDVAGNSGGCGGGGSDGGAAGAGTANQGYDGGSATDGYGGGGGGGAGAVGGIWNGPGATGTRDGGAGQVSTITGTSVTRGGGGGGKQRNNGSEGAGGAGGGGASPGTAGTANTGGGGGAQGNAGGSGVVILKYIDSLTITIGAGLTGTESAASGGYKRATITAGTGNVSWA